MLFFCRITFNYNICNRYRYTRLMLNKNIYLILILFAFIKLFIFIINFIREIREIVQHFEILTLILL